MQQGLQGSLAHGAQGVGNGDLRRVECSVDWHLGARQLGFAEFRRAREVVVDRAARHAGGIRHLGEGRVADAAMRRTGRRCRRTGESAANEAL